MDTYKFNQDEGFSKYDADGKTQLDSEDDAAYVNWGGNWRMPTKEEFKELREHCEWTWNQSKQGYIVKSKTNGTAIFLPAAGYRSDGDLDDDGSYGGYWSRSLREYYTNNAWFLSFTSDGVYSSYGYRFFALSVRSVCPRQ